jgi:hypothetical protein
VRDGRGVPSDASVEWESSKIWDRAVHMYLLRELGYVLVDDGV